MSPTRVTLSGANDTAERLVVHGAQPGKAALGGKVRTSGIEPVPRTGEELRALIVSARERHAALEAELAALPARLAAARAISRGAEREVRLQRSEVWSAVRAFGEHLGLLEIELRDLKRGSGG